MRFVFLFFIFMLTACDPLYELSYSVKNQTDKTAFIKFKDYPDSLMTIQPGATQLLATRRGIGFAREKYKSGEYQDWFFSNAIALSLQNDSTVRKLNTSHWKYKGGFISGAGYLILKKKK